MKSVAGSGDDRLEQDYMEPLPAIQGERTVIEYYNASLDHYFITSEPAEAAMLDAGTTVAGWQRTGFEFKLRPAATRAALPLAASSGRPA